MSRRNREYDGRAVSFAASRFMDLCCLFTCRPIDEIKGTDRVKRAIRAFTFHTVPGEWLDSLDRLAPMGLWKYSDEYHWRGDSLRDDVMTGKVKASREVLDVVRLGCYMEIAFELWNEKLEEDGRDKHRYRNLVFKGKRAASKVEKTGRELGVDKDVYAYLQGVPLEDILGHAPIVYRRAGQDDVFGGGNNGL